MTEVYFICACGKVLAVDEKGVGITVNCTDCGNPVEVPIPDIRWDCACGNKMSCPGEYSGQSFQCANCGKQVLAPSSDDTASPLVPVLPHGVPKPSVPAYEQAKAKTATKVRPSAPSGTLEFTVDGVTLLAKPQKDSKGKTFAWTITADLRPLLQLTKQGIKTTSTFKGKTAEHEVKAWFESGMKSFSFSPTGEEGISILVDGNPVDRTRERPADFMGHAMYGFWFVFALFTTRVVVSIFHEAMAARVIGLIFYGTPMIVLLVLGSTFHQKTRVKLITALILGILESVFYAADLAVGLSSPATHSVTSSMIIWSSFRVMALGNLIKGIRGTRGITAISSIEH
ncbi:MAG: hypothetical protein HY343_12010 [Lentisphaerae bacterium]|nr:hypothetical protein [Lentisphaerota bacterium]